MSGSLTLEQRAKRNATRLNNKTKKRYPLFADQFATTIEKQTERLRQLDVATAGSADRLREMSRAMWQNGIERRAALALVISAEELTQCDAKWETIFGANGISPRSPDQGGEYYADHWWTCAKQYAPAWAQEHCPNIICHTEAVYRREGKCPTCGRLLTSVQPVTLPDVVIQPLLFG
jgi:hypothetical protein